MTLTPEQQASLERLRKMRAELNDRDGGYPNTPDGRLQSAIDHCAAAEIALRDYPADDDCKMSRQDLIEELDAANETINNMGTELTLLEDRLKQIEGDGANTEQPSPLPEQH